MSLLLFWEQQVQSEAGVFLRRNAVRQVDVGKGETHDDIEDVRDGVTRTLET